MKNKKDESKQKTRAALAAGALLAILLLSQNNPLASAGGNLSTANASSSSTTLYYGGGGGGGGGTPSPPDGGFLCDTCDAFFVEGNPGLPGNIITKNDFLAGIRANFPFIAPQGHWNCNGTCVYNGVTYPSYNCVPDPEQEIPENGFDDYNGETPECWCLKANPGACNWYDSNFGEGLDNWQCGGSCPVGQYCGTVGNDANGKVKCVCKPDQQEQPCGFHAPVYAKSQYSQAYCSGYCENGGECEYKVNITSGAPICSCTKPSATSCESVDTREGAEWYRCYEADCRLGEECVFDYATRKCKCQGEEDCGYHLNDEQVADLYDMYKGDYVHMNQYMGAMTNGFVCYGGCSFTTQECRSTYMQDPIMQSYYDCVCNDLETLGCDLISNPDMCYAGDCALGVCKVRDYPTRTSACYCDLSVDDFNPLITTLYPLKTSTTWFTKYTTTTTTSTSLVRLSTVTTLWRIF